MSLCLFVLVCLPCLTTYLNIKEYRILLALNNRKRNLRGPADISVLAGSSNKIHVLWDTDPVQPPFTASAHNRHQTIASEWICEHITGNPLSHERPSQQEQTLLFPPVWRWRWYALALWPSVITTIALSTRVSVQVGNIQILDFSIFSFLSP